ncbi:hypothetical protein HanRHA438_Chr15g0699111 [Helianthus annuus]|nr:hypothetical protein HanRHA438_Chr15g0699111 [Helianthus annuus]
MAWMLSMVPCLENSSSFVWPQDTLHKSSLDALFLAFQLLNLCSPWLLVFGSLHVPTGHARSMLRLPMMLLNTTVLQALTLFYTICLLTFGPSSKVFFVHHKLLDIPHATI